MESAPRPAAYKHTGYVAQSSAGKAARHVLITLSLLAGLALTSFAMAQLPQAETAQGIRYVTGGFGSDEAAAFKSGKSQYPVAITFAATGPDGATPYVAEVPVEFVDEQGKTVLSLPSVGPYLLVDLPAGSYTVRASYEGKTQEQKIKVAGPGSVDVRMAWKRSGMGPD